ncbi:MAG TPA: DNA methylase [Bacteroidetes bacterium]|nr:DNA methylase [Bacteroidota bacterium]
MTGSGKVVLFSLKDAPALIEHIFPAQKLSVESYKEQMAGQGKTLTALGNFWKGRKPLILNKACILGALLPATGNLKRDLEIFEKLMGMDDESFVVRIGRIKSKDIVARVPLQEIERYFTVDPPGSLPKNAPFLVEEYVTSGGKIPKIKWRDEVPEPERRQIEARALPPLNYLDLVIISDRPESCGSEMSAHIWDDVNAHLGTRANSIPELVEQLGLMRFGRRPRAVDAFCGSGQIPFEAARLGCDVYASDLNPVACMLTWGAFNIVGAPEEKRKELATAQEKLVQKVQREIDDLGVEMDERGRRAKVFLYCLETTCPQSGWIVPMLPTRVVSIGYAVVARLVPDKKNKRYEIEIVSDVSAKEMAEAARGTIVDGYLEHAIEGKLFQTKLTTLRGDYTAGGGTTKNRLRLWEKTDIVFRETDVYRERLYAIQWQEEVPVGSRRRPKSKFRSVTSKDLAREKKVTDYVSAHLAEWQEKGWVPDMVIEPGDETERLYRERGWTHWHHLFNPRQLMIGAMYKKNIRADNAFGFTQILNFGSKLCRWTTSPARRAKDGSGKQIGGASNNVADSFYNQALNTLYSYGSRATASVLPLALANYKGFSLPEGISLSVCAGPVTEIPMCEADLFVTDPPYGDAVKYEEILEFFIAWLRKNPPPEFAGWTWDSRRALAIKGEDEEFRLGMVAAYKRMTEMMSADGLQIIMFTHQSGSIWADMANIVWASGLRVTAAWYVVTETDSAIRGKGNHHVKGTVLLVLRKRLGEKKTSRDDLAMDIQDEVEEQVSTLTGFNQEAKGHNRNENLFSDADLQMAGYAAALRVLTRYAVIDGKDMTVEALRPRVKGQTTFVDDLITFAVETANCCLVPQGIEKSYWDKIQPSERFYLKMLDIEAQGYKTLDNYQNFAKAFKVKDFRPFMASERANAARLKSAADFGRAEMSGDSEFASSTMRGILYALMELQKEVDGDEVVKHLSYNVPDFFNQRDGIVEISDYLARKLEGIRPEEASAARVLRDLIRHQRV